MAPSPAKKAKIGKSPSQSNIKELFAKSALKPSVTINQKSKEDEELEWAIQESLREDERRKAVSVNSIELNKPDILSPSLNSTENFQNCSSSTQFIRPNAKPLQRKQYQINQSDAVSGKGDGPSFSSSKDSITTVSSFAPSNGSSPNTSLTAIESITSSSSASSSSRNAFSKLMSTHSEAKEWATADLVESKNYTGAARSRPQRRTAPFYKILTGMPICVDGFRFGEIEGCTAYFLSHFHADHYGGMTSVWNHGPVYCSVTTANLVRSSLRVQDQYVCPLPMNETVVIPKTGGVRVTLLDANHCPGSCIFLFEGPQTCHILPTAPGYNHPPLPSPNMTYRYLHCGDFRASPKHVNHPLIKGKRLDIIYLDTTYCNPRYCFPAQEMVVNACAEIVRRAAPEQCRRGQLSRKEMMLEEEDWRSSPLKGKKLDAFRQAEDDKKGANALHSWLNGKEEMKKSEDGNVNGDIVVKDEGTEEAEFDEMDFQDEIFQMAEENDELSLDMEKDGTNNEFDEVGEIVVKEEVTEEKTLFKPTENANSSPLTDVKVKDEKLPINDFHHVLVVVGTYTIGKEKIVLACARALGTKIYCSDPRKYRVYAQLEDAELHSLLTRDPLQAYVHVTSLMGISGEALQDHTSKMRSQGMRIDRSIAFRPTGWTYRPPTGMDTVSPSLDRLIQWNQSRTFSASHLTSTRDSSMKYTIFGVPYSEHSSFFELTAFCLSVEYGRIIATVNVGNPNSRNKMARWFDKWKAEKKRRNGEAVDSRSDDYF